MRNTEAALAYLASQKSSGSRAWRAKCMALCRTARAQGAVYPSALASMEATPKKYRIYDRSKIKPGMLAYFTDPDDSNPFEHVATVAGRDSAGRILVYTNDAYVSGGVSVVDLDWFQRNWGDTFRFAATWIGNEPIPDLQPKPKPKPKSEGASIKLAIRGVKRAIKHNRKQGRVVIVKRLERDLERLQITLKKIQSK